MKKLFFKLLLTVIGCALLYLIISINQVTFNFYCWEEQAQLFYLTAVSVSFWCVGITHYMKH